MSAIKTSPELSTAGRQDEDAAPGAPPKAGPALNFTAGLLIGTALWLPFLATADAGEWAAQTGTFGALGAFAAGVLLRITPRLRKNRRKEPRANAGTRRMTMCPGCN